MNLKKLLPTIFLITIAAAAALTAGPMAQVLDSSLFRTFRMSFNPLVLQFIVITLIAILSALIAHKSGMKKHAISILVIVYVIVTVLHRRHIFYASQIHEDFGDMQSIKDCMRASNFSSFWEYLNHSCMGNLADFVRILCYKCLCWIIPFILTDVLLIRLKKKSNPQLIDSSEED